MKNNRAIGLVFVANSISGASQGISMLAIPWYVVTTLHKESSLGIAFVIINFISLFWSIYAGGLIDRHNRKKLFIISSLIAGSVLLSVSALGYYRGEMPFMGAIVVFAATIFVYNIHFPNLYAFAQEISQVNDYARINSFLEIQNQTVSAVAGALAAILITGTTDQSLNLLGYSVHLGFDIPKWTLQDVFLLDGSTYLIAAAILSYVRYVPVAERKIDTGTTWQKLRAGFDFLRQHSLIFLFGILSFCIFVTILVVAFFLVPIYIKNHLHGNATVFATGDVSFAIGAILAGFVIRHVFKPHRGLRGIIIMTFSASAVYLVCVAPIHAIIFCLLYLVLGLSNAGTRIMRMTYLFNHTPNSVIGRTAGIFNTFNVLMRMFFIGIFSIAFFSSDDHIIYAMLILSVFLVVAGVLLLLNFKKLSGSPTTN